MPAKKKTDDLSQVVAIIVHLSEGSAIKFVSHKGYDKMLCNHGYHKFCPDCPQYECKRRRI